MPTIQNTVDWTSFLEHHLDGDIRIRAVGLAELNLLIKMYDCFSPLGTAFGLPPHTAESRRAWIKHALAHEVNVAAFSPAGDIVGHCFLVADKPGSAELAIFVHQGSRRRGIGAALLKAALEWGGAVGLRRVWSMTASDNRESLRLQTRCGFRLTELSSHEIELEIDLPACLGAHDRPDRACAL
jgi:RimJ/RimL family protein N-acetyltransferase